MFRLPTLSRHPAKVGNRNTTDCKRLQRKSTDFDLLVSTLGLSYHLTLCRPAQRKIPIKHDQNVRSEQFSVGTVHFRSKLWIPDKISVFDQNFNGIHDQNEIFDREFHYSPIGNKTRSKNCSGLRSDAQSDENIVRDFDRTFYGLIKFGILIRRLGTDRDYSDRNHSDRNPNGNFLISPIGNVWSETQSEFWAGVANTYFPNYTVARLFKTWACCFQSSSNLAGQSLQRGEPFALHRTAKWNE